VISVGSFLLANTNAKITLGSDRTYSGAFTQAPQTDLFLNGHTFTLTGQGTLDGVVHGPGKLVISAADINGFTDVFLDEATIEDAGAVNQNAGADLGVAASSGAVQIDNGATWKITNDAGINLNNSNSVITNSGLLAKTGGAGTSNITGLGMLNSTGTIEVDTG